jgi:hypothetical protein
MDPHSHNNYLNNFAPLPEEKEQQFVNVPSNEALYRLGYENYLVKQERKDLFTAQLNGFEEAAYPFGMLPPTSRTTGQYMPRSYFSPHNNFGPQEVYNLSHGNYMGNVNTKL